MEFSYDWGPCRGCAAAHLPESSVPERIPIPRWYWRPSRTETATWQQRIFRRKRRRSPQSTTANRRPEHQSSSAWRCSQLDASANDRFTGTPTCPGPPAGATTSASADAVIYVPRRIRLGRWLKQRGRRRWWWRLDAALCSARPPQQQKQRKQQSLWVATSAEPG